MSKVMTMNTCGLCPDCGSELDNPFACIDCENSAEAELAKIQAEEESLMILRGEIPKP